MAWTSFFTDSRRALREPHRLGRVDHRPDELGVVAVALRRQSGDLRLGAVVRRWDVQPGWRGPGVRRGRRRRHADARPRSPGPRAWQYAWSVAWPSSDPLLDRPPASGERYSPSARRPRGHSWRSDSAMARLDARMPAERAEQRPPRRARRTPRRDRDQRTVDVGGDSDPVGRLAIHTAAPIAMPATVPSTALTATMPMLCQTTQLRIAPRREPETRQRGQLAPSPMPGREQHVEQHGGSEQDGHDDERTRERSQTVQVGDVAGARRIAVRRHRAREPLDRDRCATSATSRPGATRHATRVWSRNCRHAAAKPRSEKPSAALNVAVVGLGEQRRPDDPDVRHLRVRPRRRCTGRPRPAITSPIADVRRVGEPRADHDLVGAVGLVDRTIKA